MNKLLLFLLLPVYSFGQICADEDTVRSNAVTLITATTARVNGTTTHFSGSVLSIQLRYVRVGQTDTATASAVGTSALRNITGLQAGTQYYYYYKSICGSGSQSQTIGAYTFTTLTSTVVYAYERSTNFPYVRVDTGFTIPRLDTGSLYRAADIGGNLRFRPADSLPYYYNGDIWKLLAVDSAGILPALNRKVDSVTVSGDSLFYWINGVSYGYILPVNLLAWKTTGNASTVAGTNFIGTTDAVGLMFKVNNVQAGYIDVDNGNTSLGENSAISITNGGSNVAIGYNALNANITGSGNTAVGASALGSVLGSYNTAIGEGALANVTGINNIAIGRYSAQYFTNDSNHLIINSLNRTNKQGDTTKSIIYGYQDATAANQRLYLNSQVYLPYATAAANAADSMMVILPSTGKVGYRAIPAGGGTPALTATYIGYGDGSNLLTGSGGFVTDGSGTATLSTALTSPTLRGSTAANGDLLIDGTSSATKASSYVDIQQVGGYVGINTASSSNNLAVPLHIGNGTYNPSVDPVLLINRTITGTSGNAHGFVDASHVVRSGTIGYNSYDAFPRLGEGYGIGFDHYAAFQARPIFNETGQSISDIYGLYSTMTNTAGTVNNYYAGYAANPSNSGTLTNNYGFYTASLTSGVNNYAFYSAGTTPSYFGGAVSMNTTATVTTSLRTPLLIGSTSANGTITLQGNNAGASNTGTNDNIIFNVGNTPTKAGAFLNNGTLKLGTTGINGRIDLTRTADGVTIGSLYQNASQTTLNTESSLRLTWGGNSIVNMGSVGLVVDHTSTTVTATSTLQTAGSFATAYRAITALRTLGATDHTINCTANTFTVTLPTAVSITGRQYTIVNSGSGTITIGTTSSQTFANINATPTTLTLAPVGAGAIVSYTVVSNGANWIVTGKVKDE